MNFFKRRQETQSKKPRPEGRLAGFWHGFVNVVLYCVVGNAGGKCNNTGVDVVNEPSAASTTTTSNTILPDFISQGQTYHRRTNHEPDPCLSILSSSHVHSPSVDRIQDGKEKENTTEVSQKRKWFSWLKKGSKKNKVVEDAAKNIDGSAKSASVKPEPNSLSESSFKILQLTASPGGARKTYHRLCVVPLHKADQVHNESCPRVDDTMSDVDLDSVLDSAAYRENLDKKSLDGDKHQDIVKTFSLSDVSSFGESEMSDSDSSSSFTEVTSLSSGELSDCWGLNDGQLPPSEEDRAQDLTTCAVDATASTNIDGPGCDDILVEGETSYASDSAAIPGDMDNTDKNTEVPNDAPDTPVDSEAPCSCDSAAIPEAIDTSVNNIKVPSDTLNTVETLDTPDRFGEVPGGTITDVYALIVRTLNLGLPKSKHPVPRGTSAGQVDKMESSEPHADRSAGGVQDKTQRSDVEEEECTSEVPDHTTTSLHKMHTEWPEQHVNIEVLLGLKAPKNSFEALVAQKFRDEEALDSANNSAQLKITAMSTQAKKDASIEAESEMSVDSGVGSHGEFTSTHAQP